MCQVLVAQHPDCFLKFHYVSDIFFLDFGVAHIVGYLFLDKVPEIRVFRRVEGAVFNVVPAVLLSSQLCRFRVRIC